MKIQIPSETEQGQPASAPRVKQRCHPLYFTWKNMMRRCYDSREVTYYMYGAVGVTVCERWHDRHNFFADIPPKPPGHTLDRMDGTKGYTPENTRWATIFEQNANKKTNVRVTLNGVTHNVAEWSRITGIEASTLARRIKAGWRPDQILNPARFHRWRRPA